MVCGAVRASVVVHESAVYFFCFFNARVVSWRPVPWVYRTCRDTRHNINESNRRLTILHDRSERDGGGGEGGKEGGMEGRGGGGRQAGNIGPS